MYDFTQGRLIPKPTTGVDLYTASWVIHTRNGDLNFAEAGVIDFWTGNLLALWTVVDGTGKWAEATGEIFAVGNFNAASRTGIVSYRGEICTL